MNILRAILEDDLDWLLKYLSIDGDFDEVTNFDAEFIHAVVQTDPSRIFEFVFSQATTAQPIDAPEERTSPLVLCFWTRILEFVLEFFEAEKFEAGFRYLQKYAESLSEDQFLERLADCNFQFVGSALSILRSRGSLQHLELFFHLCKVCDSIVHAEQAALRQQAVAVNTPLRDADEDDELDAYPFSKTLALAAVPSSVPQDLRRLQAGTSTQLASELYRQAEVEDTQKFRFLYQKSLGVYATVAILEHVVLNISANEAAFHVLNDSDKLKFREYCRDVAPLNWLLKDVVHKQATWFFHEVFEVCSVVRLKTSIVPTELFIWLRLAPSSQKPDRRLEILEYLLLHSERFEEFCADAWQSPIPTDTDADVEDSCGHKKTLLTFRSHLLIEPFFRSFDIPQLLECFRLFCVNGISDLVILEVIKDAYHAKRSRDAGLHRSRQEVGMPAFAAIEKLEAALRLAEVDCQLRQLLHKSDLFEFVQKLPATLTPTELLRVLQQSTTFRHNATIGHHRYL